MIISERMNKSIYKIIRSADDLEEENFYWDLKTPQERLEAVEFLRHQYIQAFKLPSRLDKTLFGIRLGR